MSPLRRLALGLSVLALLAGLTTAAYAAGRQHSPSPSTPTHTTTAPPTTPPTTQPEPEVEAEAEREPAPTTTRPATRPKLVVGKYCAAMHAAGWSFEEAGAYDQDHGEGGRMDADGDGIPCETVYGEVGGQGPAPVPQQDCDPAHPDDFLPSAHPDPSPA